MGCRHRIQGTWSVALIVLATVTSAAQDKPDHHAGLSAPVIHTGHPNDTRISITDRQFGTGEPRLSCPSARTR